MLEPWTACGLVNVEEAPVDSWAAIGVPQRRDQLGDDTSCVRRYLGFFARTQGLASSEGRHTRKIVVDDAVSISDAADMIKSNQILFSHFHPFEVLRHLELVFGVLARDTAMHFWWHRLVHGCVSRRGAGTPTSLRRS